MSIINEQIKDAITAGADFRAFETQINYLKGHMLRDHYIEIRAIKGKAIRQRFDRVADFSEDGALMRDIFGEALAWNADGYNIYVGIHGRDRMRGTDLDVAHMALLPADVDYVKAGASEEMAMAALYRFTPAFVVHSGNGLWGLWPVKPITDQSEYRKIVGACADQFAGFGKDATAVNPSRVMRAAGLHNVKDLATPKLAKVLTRDLTLIEMPAGYYRKIWPVVDAVEKFERKTRPAVEVSPGERHAALLSKVGQLWNLPDITREEVLAAALAYRDQLPDPEEKTDDEVEALVDWVEEHHDGNGFAGVKQSQVVTAPQAPVVIEDIPDDDAVDDGLTSETLGDLIDPVSDEQYELIRGLHRKMLGMLHSPDGLGKTVYMLYGTFCQIVRKDFSDFTAVNPHPSDTLRVLYVETEDGREGAIDRMQKLIGGTYQRRLADGTIKTVTYNNTDFDSFEQEQIKRQVRIISEGKLTGARAGTYEQLDLTNPRHMTALRREIRRHRIDLVFNVNYISHRDN